MFKKIASLVLIFSLNLISMERSSFNDWIFGRRTADRPFYDQYEHILRQVGTIDRQQPEQKQETTKYKFDGKEKDCPICLGTIAQGEEYTLLDCQHILHFDCFKRGCFMNSCYSQFECPLCRFVHTKKMRDLIDNASGIIKKADTDAVVPEKNNYDVIKKLIKELENIIIFQKNIDDELESLRGKWIDLERQKSGINGILYRGTSEQMRNLERFFSNIQMIAAEFSKIIVLHIKMENVEKELKKIYKVLNGFKLSATDEEQLQINKLNENFKRLLAEKENGLNNLSKNLAELQREKQALQERNRSICNQRDQLQAERDQLLDERNQLVGQLAQLRIDLAQSQFNLRKVSIRLSFLYKVLLITGIILVYKFWTAQKSNTKQGQAILDDASCQSIGANDSNDAIFQNIYQDFNDPIKKNQINASAWPLEKKECPFSVGF